MQPNQRGYRAGVVGHATTMPPSPLPRWRGSYLGIFARTSRDTDTYMPEDRRRRQKDGPGLAQRYTKLLRSGLLSSLAWKRKGSQLVDRWVLLLDHDSLRRAWAGLALQASGISVCPCRKNHHSCESGETPAAWYSGVEDEREEKSSSRKRVQVYVLLELQTSNLKRYDLRQEEAKMEALERNNQQQCQTDKTRNMPEPMKKKRKKGKKNQGQRAGFSSSPGRPSPQVKESKDKYVGRHGPIRRYTVAEDNEWAGKGPGHGGASQRAEMACAAIWDEEIPASQLLGEKRGRDRVGNVAARRWRYNGSDDRFERLYYGRDTKKVRPWFLLQGTKHWTWTRLGPSVATNKTAEVCAAGRPYPVSFRTWHNECIRYLIGSPPSLPTYCARRKRKAKIRMRGNPEQYRLSGTLSRL
ncbi:hypothetical protein BJ166DRAFT_503469 [Pestalotiopsis sp. NC0098]|nr:hypothetical protein BJ166DRAFT_503469 [Pestalotiopsis sp. NC0098]